MIRRRKLLVPILSLACAAAWGVCGAGCMFTPIGGDSRSMDQQRMVYPADPSPGDQRFVAIDSENRVSNGFDSGEAGPSEPELAVPRVQARPIVPPPQSGPGFVVIEPPPTTGPAE